MATPRGAEHRDLEQRLRNLEAQVRDLTSAALRRKQLSVTQGDFVVSGGGGIRVQDGGTIEASDDAGNVVVDMGGSDGLRRPWLPYHMFNLGNPGATGSGSYVTLAGGYGFSQHPFVRLWVNTFSDSGTTGQFRVGFLRNAFDFGTAVWHPAETIPAGDSGTGHGLLIPSEVGYADMAAVFVQARRTGGTGQVKMTAQYVYGSGPD